MEVTTDDTNWFLTSKIEPGEITLGPKTVELDDFVAIMLAKEYINQGYMQLSRAYCSIARPDREDWPDVLATKLCIDVSHFYKKNFVEGIEKSWRSLYCSTYSKDKKTVHPKIMYHIRKFKYSA